VRVQRLWNRAPGAQLTIDVGKITLMRMQPPREAASCVTCALDNPRPAFARGGSTGARVEVRAPRPGIPVLGTPDD